MNAEPDEPLEALAEKISGLYLPEDLNLLKSLGYETPGDCRGIVEGLETA